MVASPRNLGIGAVAQLAGELEGDDARDIGLIGQHLKIEHQPRVVGERCRDADRPIQIRHRILERG